MYILKHVKNVSVFLKSSIGLWTTLINGFITSSENGSGKRSHSWHHTDANNAGALVLHVTCTGWASPQSSELNTILTPNLQIKTWDTQSLKTCQNCTAVRLEPNCILFPLSHYTSLHGKWLVGQLWSGKTTLK